MPLDAPRELLSLANRLRLIDQTLETAPGRIRLYPVRRTLWRFLLLDSAELALLCAVLPASAKAGDADSSTAHRVGPTAWLLASLSSLDLIAIRVVGKALQGDTRAIGWICDVIEGRPERYRGDVRTSRCVQAKHSSAVDLDPVKRARMIAELEAALRKASSS